MRRRWLAVLVGVTLGLGLAEGAARIVESRRGGPALRAAPPAFRPHALLSFELAPETLRRGRETIGPAGFRGAVPTGPKPAGTLRILCLGGSTTYGDGLADGETYPARLQALLDERGGMRCEVVNLGVPGYTTAETLMNLCLKGLDLEPDAVVVYHAVNDYRPRTLPGLDAAYRAFRRVWVEEDLERTPLRAGLELLALGRLALGREVARHGLYAWTEREAPRRLSRDEVVAAGTLPIFERNLRAIAAAARAGGAALVLATQAQCAAHLARPEDRAPIDEHNEVTRRVARELGAVACEVARDFPQQGTFQPGDPVHLSAAGSEEQARRVLAALLESGALERVPVRADAPSDPARPALEALDSPLSDAERAALADGAVFRPAPYFAYDLAPGPVGPGTLGPHDAHGFRGAEAAPARATIAVVGGASAYGLGVDDAHSTPRRLEALLRASGVDVRVLNAGVPGHTTAEGLAHLHFEVLARARPDVVVIAHDVEDALALAAPGFRGDYGHLRKPLRAEEPRGPERWLERAARAGCDALGCGAPLRSLRPAAPPYAAGGLARAAGPWALQRNLRTLVALARAEGARVVLLRAAAGDAAPAVRRAIEDWNAALERAAQDGDALVADAAAGADASAHFLAGGWLPSVAGHEHRAAVLAEVLRPLLEDR